LHRRKQKARCRFPGAGLTMSAVMAMCHRFARRVKRKGSVRHTGIKMETLGVGAQTNAP
jgi:hypothetical protein